MGMGMGMGIGMGMGTRIACAEHFPTVCRTSPWRRGKQKTNATTSKNITKHILDYWQLAIMKADNAEVQKERMGNLVRNVTEVEEYYHAEGLPLKIGELVKARDLL